MVFVCHVSGRRFTGGLFWQVGAYASEPVIVFFVLSGFVIAYVTQERETSASAFTVARAARIYSVALPALLLTFLLDSAGRSIRPDLYSATWGYFADGRLLQFASNLFFVQRLWFLNIAPGSDLPYWTLGNEVWYYITFGIAFFAPNRWRLLGTLAALGVAGPIIAVRFPIWLLGVVCYHICARAQFGRRIGATLCVGSMAIWVAYHVWSWRYGGLLNQVTFLGEPGLAEDYMIGILFALHLVGFRAISPIFATVLGRFAGPIRWTAGATFSLYLFHLPVAQFLITQVPWPPSAVLTRITVYGGTLLAIFALAEVTERRKDLWRRAFAKLLVRPVRSTAS